MNSNNRPIAVSDTNDLCQLMRRHIAGGHVQPLMNIHVHAWAMGPDEAGAGWLAA
jgi:hypothetical protein